MNTSSNPPGAFVASMSGEVLALSTALPQWLNIRGRPVFTSIVREPLAGPLYFGAAGIANNRPAVHTEQVLAFTASHYDYWTQRLGITRERWPWAFWGENLTLTGIDENHLHVGDRVHIGRVVMEVTAPRVPCFKLAWRLEQPDSFLKTLTTTGFVGFYLRVLTPGEITTGDRVRVENRGSDVITVGELSRLFTSNGREDLPALRRVAALPALGRLMGMLLRQRIAYLEDVERCRDHRWRGWRDFRIAAVSHETPQIVSIRLTPEDGFPIAPYRAGQHLMVTVPAVAGDVMRSWSLSEYQEQPRDYRLTIKRGSGPGSAWIHDSARVGTRLKIRAPAGRFVLDRSSFKRVVLVSAGVGLTPMVSMLRAHTERADAPALIWLHSTQHGKTLVLGEEVNTLLARSPTFVRQLNFSQPRPDDILGTHYDRAGKIDAHALRTILETPFQAGDVREGIVQLPGEISQFYLCGPPNFMAMVKRTLTEAGVADADIFSESFEPTVRDVTDSSATRSATVVFARSGAEATWTAEDSLTLLELAELSGLEPEFSCRMGTCGTCQARLVEGHVACDPQPLDPPPAGYALPCCSRPASTRVVLDL